MRFTKRWSGILILTSAAALSACAASKTAPLPPTTISVATSRGPGGGTTEQVVKVTASVEAVDLTKRLVMLKGSDGETVTIKVSDDVKNLPQVKKGDLVRVALYESIAYEVKKKGTAKPSIEETSDAATAPLGAKPAGAVGSAVTITATITAIDQKASTVTLKGPEGNSLKVKVRDPERLEGVRVGDLVEITYTEAVAIAVEQAPES